MTSLRGVLNKYIAVVNIPILCSLLMFYISWGEAIECYDCVGIKSRSMDYCFRGNRLLLSIVEKKICDGFCVKYTFWGTKNQRYGVVRRSCAPAGMTCQEVAEPAQEQTGKLLVPTNSEISISWDCDFCNHTLCNDSTMGQSHLMYSILPFIVKLICN